MVDRRWHIMGAAISGRRVAWGIFPQLSTVMKIVIRRNRCRQLLRGAVADVTTAMPGVTNMAARIINARLQRNRHVAGVVQRAMTKSNASEGIIKNLALPKAT